MSDLWFWGSIWAQAVAGEESPQPVPPADPNWTWRLDFFTSPAQTTYARTSLNSYSCTGEGAAGGGIVEYQTRDAQNNVTTHTFASDPNADENLENFIADAGVGSVTFGWYVRAGGSDLCFADMTMEVWVS